MEPWRQRVVDEARLMVGTPYHHQGRAPGYGIDCIGLIVMTGRALGFEIADVDDYHMQGNGTLLVDCLSAHMDSISIDDAGPGDVVTFRIRNGGGAHHAGILSDYGLIHSFAHVKRCVEHAYSDPWPRRALGAFRWPNHG